MKNLKILDSTLREGEQYPGVRFTSQDKIHLLRLLEEFSVDLVEVGHPGISPEDEQICKEVAGKAHKAEILMHARAVSSEIQAVSRAKAHWVGIWASINPVSLASKFRGRTRHEVKDQVASAVEEAKRLGLQVRFTIEDASRTSWEDLCYLGKAAVDAGADRISLADTTGIWEPVTCANVVKKAIKELHPDIEIHLHNDLGLALANALTAIDAGATVVDTSILGIGERTGIVDLLQLAVLLHEKRDCRKFPLEQIPGLSQSVQWITGFRPEPLKPVTGKNAFTHTSRYHVQAVGKDSRSYEPYPPVRVGRSRTVLPQRARLGVPVFPYNLKIGKPFEKGASELKYHRNGPGTRWVLMDNRVDPRSTLYVIQRFFNDNPPENHVDLHTHHCDSVFLFWGDTPDGTGLICSVQVGNEEKVVHSPVSVFIPAGVAHAYCYIAGRGTYTNIVLAPEYNQSLEEPFRPAKPDRDMV
ncbi:LeuA family protein [Thermoactinomyces mirandus]|uniref:2-isopropylmalate synthase n=1 Tax=Thermoactinomyces mirandus TaxID=2756294 RepID=A0A7W2ARA1_9BACL|nr:2-isopropylmalate synthase [Thermoactinomyces mirandus]MBA4602122.1 2-isopropylmalate synthase [Thermoactinomyces mirandus]